LLLSFLEKYKITVHNTFTPKCDHHQSNHAAQQQPTQSASSVQSQPLQPQSTTSAEQQTHTRQATVTSLPTAANEQHRNEQQHSNATPTTSVIAHVDAATTTNAALQQTRSNDNQTRPLQTQLPWLKHHNYTNWLNKNVPRHRPTTNNIHIVDGTSETHIETMVQQHGCKNSMITWGPRQREQPGITTRSQQQPTTRWCMHIWKGGFNYKQSASRVAAETYKTGKQQDSSRYNSSTKPTETKRDHDNNNMVGQCNSHNSQTSQMRYNTLQTICKNETQTNAHKQTQRTQARNYYYDC
jgi:hypothetical protein